jgi:hypothetical protein
LRVRDLVVKHMSSNPCASLLSDYLADDVNNYLNKSGMASDRTWATDAEIFGAANLIGIDIAVWSFSGNKLAWLKYPASTKLNQLTTYTLLLENETRNHFNVVVSLKSVN